MDLDFLSLRSIILQKGVAEGRRSSLTPSPRWRQDTQPGACSAGEGKRGGYPNKAEPTGSNTQRSEHTEY